MKFTMLAIVLMASSAVSAQSDAQKCFSIKNDLDRKYCIDKHLESVKTKLNADKKAWGASLTGEAKETKTEAIQGEIQARKDQQGLVQSELALYEKHLTDLNAVAVSTPAPAKKKKKDKKKKLPFGIKL